MSKHERIYCTLLAVVAIMGLCSALMLGALMTLPAAHRPPSNLPEWSYPILALMNGAYFVMASLALVLRWSSPGVGRKFTRGVNFALLFGPPFGTALGLYGLWKVDQSPVDCTSTAAA